LYYSIAAATLFGTGLSIKSELISGKLLNAQKELSEKKELISQSIAQFKQVQDSIKELDAKNYAVKMINYKIDNRFNTLKASTNSMLDDAIVLRDLIDNPDLTVTDKINRIRDFNNISNISFERDIADFKKLSDSLSLDNASSLQSTPNLHIDPSDIPSSSASTSSFGSTASNSLLSCQRQESLLTPLL
jgi:hypothetical protein